MKRQHGVDGFVRRPSYMEVINHMKQGFPANENVPYPDIKYQTAEAGFINSQKFEIQPNLVSSQAAPPLAGTWAGTPPPIHVHATFMDPPRGGGGGRRPRRGVVRASTGGDGWDGDTPDRPDLRAVGWKLWRGITICWKRWQQVGGPMILTQMAWQPVKTANEAFTFICTSSLKTPWMLMR